MMSAVGRPWGLTMVHQQRALQCYMRNCLVRDALQGALVHDVLQVEKGKWCQVCSLPDAAIAAAMRKSAPANAAANALPEPVSQFRPQPLSSSAAALTSAADVQPQQLLRPWSRKVAATETVGLRPVSTAVAKWQLLKVLAPGLSAWQLQSDSY